MTAERQRELVCELARHDETGIWRLCVECDGDITEAWISDPTNVLPDWPPTSARLKEHPLALELRARHLATCHACAVWLADA